MIIVLMYLLLGVIIGVVLLFIAFVGYLQHWRHNLKVGDRCRYYGLDGALITTYVLEISGKMARIPLGSASQWVTKSNLFPAPVKRGQK